MEALVIGKPNVGKSLFVINFAAYLGAKDVRLQGVDTKGAVSKKTFLSLEEARHKLVSPKPHKTLGLHTVGIDVVIGRQRKTLWILDSVGISEGIHHQSEIRQAMAATLARLGNVDLIIHVIDLTGIGAKMIESPGPVDDEIFHYARRLAPYLVIANKIDKPGAMDHLASIRERFKGSPVIGVSALTRRGFKEVKGLTLRYLDA